MECSQCLAKENLKALQCGCILCNQCLFSTVYERLKETEQLLKIDRSSRVDKNQLVSCKKNCGTEGSEENFADLVNLLNSFEAENSEKNDFKRLLKLAEGSVSGKQYGFFVCDRCGKLKFEDNEISFVCIECIEELCIEQTGTRPTKIKLANGKPRSETEQYRNSGNPYSLLILLDSLSIFKFEAFENFIRIYKVRKILDRKEVLLVKPNLLSPMHSEYIEVTGFETMGDISSYKLYL